MSIIVSVDEARDVLHDVRAATGDMGHRFFRLPEAMVRSQVAHIGRVAISGVDETPFKSIAICGCRSWKLGTDVTGTERMCGNCLVRAKILMGERC